MMEILQNRELMYFTIEMYSAIVIALLVGGLIHWHNSKDKS